MRPSDLTSRHRLPLAAIVVAAFTLRALPLFQTNGALGTADFDDGVYFSAAAHLLSGVLPYDDFVFVHPPGVLILLAPFALVGEHVIGYADAFALARWSVCLVGAANTLLVGAAASRWVAPRAGVVAAALYAVFPPAVRTESLILLEPFLNLAVLVGALAWLGRPNPNAVDRRAIVAGVAFGLAITIKLYAVVALVAALVAPTGRALRARGYLIASAGLTCAAVVAPFAVLAGSTDILDQFVRTQLERPSGDVEGGEIVGILDRSLHMLYYGPGPPERFPAVVGAALFAGALLSAAWAWRRGFEGRFWSAMWASAAVTLLAAPSYYDQYAVLLAPATCVLAGAVVDRLLQTTLVPLRAVVSVAAVALPTLVGVDLIHDWKDRGDPPHFASVVIAQVPQDACLYADPPILSLAADRLSDSTRAGDPLVDPFGELLYLASRHGRRSETVAEALMSRPAQARVQDVLSECDFVVLRRGPEDNPRWSAVTRMRFRSNFQVVAGSEGEAFVWMRSSRR